MRFNGDAVKITLCLFLRNPLIVAKNMDLIVAFKKQSCKIQ